MMYLAAFLIGLVSSFLIEKAGGNGGHFVAFGIATGTILSAAGLIPMVLSNLLLLAPLYLGGNIAGGVAGSCAREGQLPSLDLPARCLFCGSWTTGEDSYIPFGETEEELVPCCPECQEKRSLSSRPQTKPTPT